jgi:thymidylate synthase
MKVFNRSSDLFLGLPFNITSSSLFLILIARVCQLKPRNLFINLGDAHIYEQHLQAVNTQLDRFPYSFPKIFINKDIKNLNDLESLSFDDFEIKNYKHNEKIKAQMIA